MGCGRGSTSPRPLTTIKFKSKVLILFSLFLRNPNGNANVLTLPGREASKRTHISIVNADLNVVMPELVQARRHGTADKGIPSHDAILGSLSRGTTPY